MSESIRKMVLIDPERLKINNTHSIQPVDSILTGFEDQLKKNLSSENKPQKKVFLFNQIFSKFASYQANRDQFKEYKRDDIGEVDQPEEELEEGLISKVSRSYRHKAAILISHMAENFVKWNEDGEIIISGKTVPGTNVSKLINYITGTGKKPPVGLDDLLAYLRTTNTPLTVFGSKAKKKEFAEGMVGSGVRRKRKVKRANKKVKRRRVKQKRVKRKKAPKKTNKNLIWHKIKKF